MNSDKIRFPCILTMNELLILLNTAVASLHIIGLNTGYREGAVRSVVENVRMRLSTIDIEIKSGEVNE